MQLTEDVYLVGGSPLNGFGLSDGMDSHVYLVDGGSAIALIDCGMAWGNSLERISRTIEGHGFSLDLLEKIFVTHYHVDHMGGLAAWQARFGLSVAVGAEAADAISQADVHSTGFQVARELGIYPPDYRLLPADVDDPLEDRGRRRIGELAIESIATPGHCRGHISYLLHGRDRASLFTGDSVFFGGKILLANTPDSDVQDYRSSVLKLDSFDFAALFPGHGAICLAEGKAHVRLAADAFRTLTLPRNLI